MSAIGGKADINRARRNVRPRFAAAPSVTGDTPLRALRSPLEFWKANRASTRYYDRDMRVLSRGIFQQT